MMIRAKPGLARSQGVWSREKQRNCNANVPDPSVLIYFPRKMCYRDAACRCGKERLCSSIWCALQRARRQLSPGQARSACSTRSSQPLHQGLFPQFTGQVILRHDMVHGRVGSAWRPCYTLQLALQQIWRLVTGLHKEGLDLSFFISVNHNIKGLVYKIIE